MKLRLARWYRQTGIPDTPPGTLFHWIHTRIQALRERGRVRGALAGHVTGDAFSQSKFGTATWYNIPRVRRERTVGGIALIFHLGLGDYLMATPLIEELRLAHPDLPIYAYVSSTADSVNSPLVAHFLRANPSIGQVFMYRGRMGESWRNYDFRDALKDIPSDFLIMPVIYEVRPSVVHRVTSLMEAFGLPVRLPILPPIIRPSPMTGTAEALLATIEKAYDGSRHQGIVLTHFGARSSGYEYPKTDAVLRRLTRERFLAVTFSETTLESTELIKIDVTTITPTDTAEIVRNLLARQMPLWFLTVNSVMWPLSAAFNIPNLGVHVFWDLSVHQYLYPNIFLVTNHHYRTVSPSRVFQALPSQVEERQSRHGVTFSDYDPDFLVECFVQLTEIVSANRIPPITPTPAQLAAPPVNT